MISEFIAQQLQRARYKLLNDGTCYGWIPGSRGVWANARTLERCREELREVLEDWLLLKLWNHARLPALRATHRRRTRAYA